MMATSVSGRLEHEPESRDRAQWHARKLPRMIGNQCPESWERWPPCLLLGKTMAQVGIGAISEGLARPGLRVSM